jgi:hypothetical protein
MSLTSSLASSTASLSSLTSTTSPVISLSHILTGAAIAIGALTFLLALDVVMSERDSWNANTAALLRVIYVPLVVTFCALIAFKTAQFL